MSGMRLRRADRRRSESGESLIEVSLTVAIMGVALVAFVSLSFSVTVSSAAHKRNVLAGNVATSVAEQLDGIDYVKCTTSTNPSTYTAALSLAPATVADSTKGYTSSLSYRYLTDASVLPAAAGPTFQGGCPTADNGVQEITVTVNTKSTPGGKAKIVMYKRQNLCAQLGYTAPIAEQLC